MNIVNWLNEGLEKKYFHNILDEDLEYEKTKWPNLSDEEFDRCVGADPTYKEGDKSIGKYGKWVLKVYSNFVKQHPNEEFNFAACTKDLGAFNDLLLHKRFEDDKDKRKNIDYYKTAQELHDFLDNKSNYKEPGSRQQWKDQNRTAGTVDHVDPDLVFENDRCKVWVPYTYETSRQLGGDTRWCTAASTRGNWDSYSKEGPLFIMIMKRDPQEKYQFFFASNPEDNQFMNRNDYPVDISRFPEMQMSWVDEVRKEYYGIHNKILVNQLSAILNPDGTVPEDCAEKARDLIKGLHDEVLISKYSAPLNKEYLDLFYENLTPTLTGDSKAIEYLKQCVGKVDIVLPRSVKSLGDGCFHFCPLLRSVSVPDSITSLPDDCFYQCSSLQEVNLSEGITSLGNRCFNGCESLQKINLPDSITSLGDFCFYRCTSLQTITLPDSITSIGNSCFECCSSLQEINLPNSITSLGDRCFYGCTSLQEIHLPDGITSLGTYCFYHCSSLQETNLPDSITSLGDRCFYYCSSLQEINLPDGITSLPTYCFDYCSSLQEINLPDSITSIDDSCFRECSSLQTINLPDGITSLGDSCFNGCSSLREINLPDGITSLGDSCFYYCSSLHEIKLPSSITNIGYSCFYVCPLTDVYYSGSEENRKHIQIDSFCNEVILNATWHYNYRG